MSDNGKKLKTLVKVELDNGKMSIELDLDKDTNVALVSHALRLASLQLDNALIGKAVEKESNIKTVSQLPDILKRMRK